MDENRTRLWIAMSDLWLDRELTQDELESIASVVERSQLTRVELEDVFRFELAPFLGGNQRVVAGQWAGFDPDWVCENAARLVGKRRTIDRISSATGHSTGAARADWDLVLNRVFGDSTK